MSLDKLMDRARKAIREARRSDRDTETVGKRHTSPVTRSNTVPPEELEKAEADFASSPPSLERMLALAHLYYAGNRFHEARALFQTLLDEGVDPPEQRFFIGNCCFRLDLHREALEYWRQCLDSSPSAVLEIKALGRIDWVEALLASDAVDESSTP